eukprot:Mycagemm_TRINITY_DN10105_c0_g1::TRINITY_DN10105_c0_g1_i1::g.5209::m.5209 type:complete len:107 gc:universal TRINITY_DN10105_c0_g1_i1:1520-1200(-)
MSFWMFFAILGSLRYSCAAAGFSPRVLSTICIKGSCRMAWISGSAIARFSCSGSPPLPWPSCTLYSVFWMLSLSSWFSGSSRRPWSYTSRALWYSLVQKCTRPLRM